MRLPLALLACALMLPNAAVLAADPTPRQPPIERVRIYQLLVRLFGNTNETRKQNGTLAENGVGKFNDINDAALSSLQEMGFTHLWLTGVLQQATHTDYSSIGRPADDPDLLKGLAGSPYAIKDYFDVCPDYAQDPAKRMDEFAALLKRVHAHGLKAIIDFVPNHVARSYHSASHPDLDFGTSDDKDVFFRRDNNFFYLRPGDPAKGEIPPLRLPTYDFKTQQPLSATCQVLGGACDGHFSGEIEFGRVTGSNDATWSPSSGSWYETVKLNYGFDFNDPTKERREYPRAGFPDAPLPDTWRKMDAVLAFWQAQGVDGFRCDMAHWIPPEFWRWEIARARERAPGVFFVAEAYDDDSNKVPPTGDTTPKHVMQILLEAGFDAVYDDPSYKTVKGIYDTPRWANDLDAAAAKNELIFQRGLRYAENHDEVRLAAPKQWSGLGAAVGKPVCGVLFALSRGPVMIYSGQEVGEPGAGVEGFGEDDNRTSIFDYWSMPELVKWVNGHAYDGGGLSAAQKDLRGFYGRLLRTVGQPAFRDGTFYPLNPDNNGNPAYGRLPGETASGHWLYSCLRCDPTSGQRYLVVVNLHPSQTFDRVGIRLTSSALMLLRATSRPENAHWLFSEKLSSGGKTTARLNAASGEISVEVANLPPLTPCYFEVQEVR